MCEPFIYGHFQVFKFVRHLIQTPTHKNLLLYKAGYLLYLVVHFCTVLVFLHIVSGENIVILLS